MAAEYKEYKIFVGGLSWDTDDSALWEAFKQFGEIPFCRVVCDRETGKSRGFGFVSFTDPEARSKAIAEMNEKELDGRWLKVVDADKPKDENGKGPLPQKNKTTPHFEDDWDFEDDYFEDDWDILYDWDYFEVRDLMTTSNKRPGHSRNIVRNGPKEMSSECQKNIDRNGGHVPRHRRLSYRS